jgi:hypothetical protein
MRGHFCSKIKISVKLSNNGRKEGRPERNIGLINQNNWARENVT